MTKENNSAVETGAKGKKRGKKIAIAAIAAALALGCCGVAAWQLSPWGKAAQEQQQEQSEGDEALKKALGLVTVVKEGKKGEKDETRAYPITEDMVADGAERDIVWGKAKITVSRTDAGELVAKFDGCKGEATCCNKKTLERGGFTVSWQTVDEFKGKRSGSSESDGSMDCTQPDCGSGSGSGCSCSGGSCG